MMKRLALLLCLVLSVAAPASAQEELGVSKIYLNGSPTLNSGSGTPEAAVTATPGSLFLRTDNGTLYAKGSGTGNTGWLLLIVGGGTTNALPLWTAAGAIGDSMITQASSDIIVTPTGKDVLPGVGYDTNLGALTKKFLTLHAAELWVETLVAQSTMATIGGRIVVAPTTTLTVDLPAANTSMAVKHNNLAIGDIVMLEANASVEFLAVTAGPSGTGPYVYSITRNLDTSGANNWTAGDAVVDTGQTGNGFIDIYSVRGAKRSSYVDGVAFAGTEIGPTIVFNRRTSSTYNAWSPRAAIGNLDGLYGYSGSNYGAAFGDPSGPRATIDATNGVRLFAQSSATGARVTLDATNGLRIYGSDNDEKVTIDTSGNATFDGEITVGTARNQIRNSECRVSTDDFSVFTDHGLSTTLGTGLASFRLNDEVNTCYVSIVGTPANTKVTNLFNTVYHPVIAGSKYEASVYVGMHRLPTGHVDIIWYNNAGTLLSVSTGSTCTDASAGGTTLVGYCRSTLIATAPASATKARVQFATTHDGTDTDPFLFAVRWFFGEAKPLQEDPTQWGPAGITSINNGLIETDAITARTILAGTITADRLNVSTLSAITANLGTVTAGSISGVTATFGSGSEVTLNSSGITLNAGTGANNKIKWTDGSQITGNASTLFLATGNVHLGSGATELVLDSGGSLTEQGIGDVTIGTNSLPFEKMFARNFRMTSFSGGGASHFVCNDNNGDFYSSATTCDGSAPAPSVLALQREIQELREQLQQLQALIPAAIPAIERPLPGARQ
jgi:hypothetical protein